jgi:CRP-like cAMP-binding protein
MDIAMIKGIGFFAALTEAEIKTLLGMAREVSFEREQTVIRQGQPHSSLYLIAEGMLHVNRKAERSEVFLGRLEKGGFFGEIGLFDPGTATASIRAMEKSRLFEISREKFQEFIETNPALACKVLSAMMVEMARRLRRVDQRLVDSFFWGASGLAK